MQLEVPFPFHCSPSTQSFALSFTILFRLSSKYLEPIMRRAFLLITILAIAWSAQAAEIRTGEDLLRAMYERYNLSRYNLIYVRTPQQ